MPEPIDASGLPPDVRRTAVTVGTFDGVHLGHHDVLRNLVTMARAAEMSSLLVTFAPHPNEVVRPSAVPMLLTPGMEKFEALATIGIDYCAVMPFTRALASLTAAEFVRRVLRPRFRMEALLIGHDHGFGRDREGGRAQLMALGESDDFAVQRVDPVALPDGTVVSSSAIRKAVADGDLESARQGLGRRYSMSGIVQQGDQRGRTIGFPTINLGTPPARKLLPPAGVYAVIAQTPGGAYPAMMNLGARPTVADARQTVEAHLLDFSGDLYDEPARVRFVERLRGEEKFESVEALVEQMQRDCDDARAVLG